MEKIYKVLIADDHLMMAAGIEAMLESNEQYQVIGKEGNGRDVLSALERESVDIVLMDIRMPDMDGITCTRKVKEKFPDTKVIIITMYNQRKFLREAWEAGANGYVLKSNTGKELISALDGVVAGRSYFEAMQDLSSRNNDLNQYNLSERELEIIELIAENLTSKDIAGRLFISEHTVKTHRKNIFRKLEVKDVGELIQFAMNEGLI